MVKMPFGEMPGRAVLGLAMTDNFTHGWDLAQATGQSTDLAPELAAQLLESSRQMIQPAFRGEDGAAPFGPRAGMPRRRQQRRPTRCVPRPYRRLIVLHSDVGQAPRHCAARRLRAAAHEVEKTLLQRCVVGHCAARAVAEHTELGNDRCHRGNVVPRDLHHTGVE